MSFVINFLYAVWWGKGNGCKSDVHYNEKKWYGLELNIEYGGAEGFVVKQWWPNFVRTNAIWLNSCSWILLYYGLYHNLIIIQCVINWRNVNYRFFTARKWFCWNSISKLIYISNLILLWINSLFFIIKGFAACYINSLPAKNT